jgi:hypothetical protein
VPTWLTDAQLLARTEAIFRPGDESVTPGWLETTVADANAAAHGCVVSALAARGFSPAQIAAWVRAREFVVDIALYFVAVKGKLDLDTATRGQHIPSIELDRRKELEEVDVTDAEGNLQYPENPGIKPVSHGRLNTEHERFRTRTGHWRRW